MKLEFVGINTNKLHDELISAGIIPSLVENLDNKTWITVDDNQVAATNAVVAIHDPTPIYHDIIPSLDEVAAGLIDAMSAIMVLSLE
jgi:hypothetical protein